MDDLDLVQQIGNAFREGGPPNSEKTNSEKPTRKNTNSEKPTRKNQLGNAMVSQAVGAKGAGGKGVLVQARVQCPVDLGLKCLNPSYAIQHAWATGQGRPEAFAREIRVLKFGVWRRRRQTPNLRN